MFLLSCLSTPMPPKCVTICQLKIFYEKHDQQICIVHIFALTELYVSHWHACIGIGQRDVPPSSSQGLPISIVLQMSSPQWQCVFPCSYSRDSTAIRIFDISARSPGDYNAQGLPSLIEMFHCLSEWPVLSIFDSSIKNRVGWHKLSYQMVLGDRANLKLPNMEKTVQS